jgi:hypothetical protein
MGPAIIRCTFSWVPPSGYNQPLFPITRSHAHAGLCELEQKRTKTRANKHKKTQRRKPNHCFLICWRLPGAPMGLQTWRPFSSRSVKAVFVKNQNRTTNKQENKKVTNKPLFPHLLEIGWGPDGPSILEAIFAKVCQRRPVNRPTRRRSSIAQPALCLLCVVAEMPVAAK